MYLLERQPQERMTKVEAISLEGYQFRSEDLCFKDDQFKNLPILRILLLDKANLSGNFERILLNLRWLSWHFCNFSPTLPTNLNLKNLIVLDLSRSMLGSMDALTELLVDGTSIQELPILRVESEPHFLQFLSQRGNGMAASSSTISTAAYLFFIEDVH
ncbi:hypothetical protein CRG98_019461 [Punica granatum]|uniref:Uncharacterized protein n=1 Tax=Punica granatum TaxID=22663 RepID=A0A2I0JUW8_PUNGR|nr:hypothetical protein CRG98_019461 [Punica granatum]